MSIGNNQNNQPKSLTIRSKQVLFNKGELNHTCLKFEYWNGLLVLRIENCINITDENGKSSIKVDSDNGIAIYLTPYKARVFYNSIKTYLENPGKYTNVGINSGVGLITFSDGSDYNVNNYLICIRKCHEDTGNVLSSNTYEFSKGDGIIINFDDNNPQNNREQLENNIEIDILLNVLSDFISYANSASAYWNSYTFEYQNNKREELLNSIADKLGVERQNKRASNNSSFFNNNNSNNTPSAPTKNIESSSLEDMI